MEHEAELASLQEALADARAEVERLQAEAADRQARAATLEQEAVELRERLRSAEAELGARDAALAEAGREAESLRSKLAEAAAKYREVALAASPEVPADLVAGETIEDIDASIDAARRTVARVRDHLEAQAQAGRAPVGAPERRSPDAGRLTPAEKIRLGLERQG
ncbi:MAG TPA: hypothetical protein VNN12_08385 [Dehalococcoidia bacterium]|jgi:chromosome segregation ATPase|nr:hypothetical protein [Dehalococcoidia bacterium]